MSCHINTRNTTWMCTPGIISQRWFITSVVWLLDVISHLHPLGYTKIRLVPISSFEIWLFYAIRLYYGCSMIILWLDLRLRCLFMSTPDQTKKLGSYMGGTISVANYILLFGGNTRFLINQANITLWKFNIPMDNGH